MVEGNLVKSMELIEIHASWPNPIKNGDGIKWRVHLYHLWGILESKHWEIAFPFVQYALGVDGK